MFTIAFLVISNIFMIFAWYGHLGKDFKESSLWLAIMASWGIAFFEYCFQVPANRYGHVDHGGPFDTAQLKILQEVITLVVFCFFVIFYRGETLRWNYYAAFVLLVAAVALVFLFQEEKKEPVADTKGSTTPAAVAPRKPGSDD